MKNRGWVLFSMLMTVLCGFAEALPEENASAPGVDWSAEPVGGPVKTLDAGELLLSQNELQGQVVELEFNQVVELRPAENGYIARVSYDGGWDAAGVEVLLPKEGMWLFADVMDRYDWDGFEKVYVEVRENKMARALGARYNQNQPEGERYSW